MNYTKTTLLATVLAIIHLSNVFAQNAGDSPYLNRSVLRHFDGDRLSEMETQDSVKFSQIKYYFLQSFSVEDIVCQGCQVDYNEFFNSALFDVSNFETLREFQNQHSFLFHHDKYEVTLFSINEVEAELGGLSIESVLNLRHMRPFPQWVEFNEDYEHYSESIETWARDFPNEYRTLTASPDFLKIKLEDFISLSEDRQNRLFHRPGGYMIIE